MGIELNLCSSLELEELGKTDIVTLLSLPIHGHLCLSIDEALH